MVSNRYNALSYGTWYTLFSTNIELGDNSQGGYRRVYFNTPTLDNNWHHIVYTKDGTNHTVYVDGSLNQSFTSNADISWNVPTFTGRRYTGSIDPFWSNGTIDDVRIYNRALSAEEVQELYEEESPELTAIELIGPNEVAENFTAFYKAIAHYDNGTTKDVTPLAEWRVEPDTLATIEAGLLTAEQALYPERDATIYARYTENETTVDAEKQVSVLAICPTGTALYFDGVNDYVACGSGQGNLDNITVSLWMKTSTAGALVSNRYNSLSYGTWYTLFSTNIELGDNSQGGYRRVYFNTPTLDNNWHHIIYTKDGINHTVYVDGSLNQSFTSNADISWNVPTFTGRRYLGSIDPFWFNGTIDDVRIYNRALSEEEIGEIMFSRPTAGEPNLIAYWDFDDGTGQTAADVSGNGNDGILGNNSAPDVADPCWVESDAPIGQCTTEQVLVRNLLGATEDKEAANQIIAEARAKERASLELIEELRRQTRKSKHQDSFARARAQILVALAQEQMVSRQIDATIRRLEEALRLLGYEIDANGTP